MATKQAGYNPEFLRSRELPYVVDNDPEVIPKLSEVLGRVVDGELPGAGIVSAPDGGRSQLRAHRRHGLLAAAAFAKATPPARHTNNPVIRAVEEFDYGTPMHADRSTHREPRGALELLLRLHTADSFNGSTVRMMLTEAGFSLSEPGDIGQYFPYGPDKNSERDRRGYDPDSFYTSPEDFIARMPAGTYDPWLTGHDVFEFTQQPLTSVLFRSESSTGPVAAHEFTPLDSSHPRTIMYSDLLIESH